MKHKKSKNKLRNFTWIIFGIILMMVLVMAETTVSNSKIATTGNVGIGSMNPIYLLDVAGNVSLNSTLYVTGGGDVGIGTASPAVKLQIVDGTSTNTGLQVDSRIRGENRISLGTSTGAVWHWSDAGSGTTRIDPISGGTQTLNFENTGAGGPYNVNFNTGQLYINASGKVSTDNTLSESTGDEVALSFRYTTNKTSSGDDTGLLINQIDISSPGTSKLIDLQVEGVSRTNFDNNGRLNLDVQGGGGTATGIGFGSSNSRIYGDGFGSVDIEAQDTLTFRSQSSPRYHIIADLFFGSVSGAGAVRNVLSTETVPTLNPRKADLDTGVGSGTDDKLSLIAGGIEWLSLDNVGLEALFPVGDVKISGDLYVQGQKMDVPDYVFEDDYNLLTLKELEAYIEENSHLPSELQSFNSSINHRQYFLLEKIEEQAIYNIQQHYQIEELKVENDLLKDRLDNLEEKMNDQLLSWCVS